MNESCSAGLHRFRPDLPPQTSWEPERSDSKAIRFLSGRYGVLLLYSSWSEHAACGAGPCVSLPDIRRELKSRVRQAVAPCCDRRLDGIVGKHQSTRLAPCMLHSQSPFATIRWLSFVHGAPGFDADTGKDSAREIREYFVPDFSDWKNHDSYQRAFQRLL
jgi:hypothetical protein